MKVPLDDWHKEMERRNQRILRMASIYLYHAIQFVGKTCYGLPVQEEPDEKLMHALEEYAGVPSDSVYIWRSEIWSQLAMLRMDTCFKTMRNAFAWFVNTDEGKAALYKYPTAFPVSGRIFVSSHGSEIKHEPR